MKQKRLTELETKNKKKTQNQKENLSGKLQVRHCSVTGRCQVKTVKRYFHPALAMRQKSISILCNPVAGLENLQPTPKSLGPVDGAQMKLRALQ